MKRETIINEKQEYSRFSITLPAAVAKAVEIRASSNQYAGNRSGYIRDMILRDPLLSVGTIHPKTIKSRRTSRRKMQQTKARSDGK